jgi:hypothetical protein
VNVVFAAIDGWYLVDYSGEEVFNVTKDAAQNAIKLTDYDLRFYAYVWRRS